MVKEAYAARTTAKFTRGVSKGILRQGLRSGDLWTMLAGVAGNVAAGIQETVGLALDSRTPPSLRTEAQLDTAFLAVTAPVPWSRLAGLGRGVVRGDDAGWESWHTSYGLRGSNNWSRLRSYHGLFEADYAQISEFCR